MNNNYERVFQDCEADIKNCDEQISELEQEIEVIKTQKQGLEELRNALIKILSPSITESISQSDEVTDEKIIADFQTENTQPNFLVDTSNDLAEIPVDAFKGLSVVEASIKFLRIVKRPQKTPQIVEALTKGGFESKSAFFSESVRSTLRSASKSPKKGIIWKDNFWQLAEWNSSKTSQIEKANEQSSKSINNGDNSKGSKDSVSQNQRLRDIIAKYSPGTEITSNSVFESFQNQYPELASGLADKKTLISKVLREMQSAGQLEKIDGIQGDLVTYRKI
jgi:hypothetical protein